MVSTMSELFPFHWAHKRLYSPTPNRLLNKKKPKHEITLLQKIEPGQRNPGGFLDGERGKSGEGFGRYRIYI